MTRLEMRKEIDKVSRFAGGPCLAFETWDSMKPTLEFPGLKIQTWGHRPRAATYLVQPERSADGRIVVVCDPGRLGRIHGQSITRTAAGYFQARRRIDALVTFSVIEQYPFS